ncbi:glycoside hydrolase superfamily [Microdochium trichocladiopsis]|uniref:Alpha-galactosidase n=1 Tax=Microdochium trichocladiopsis TaxID=1682393 RepID=A0A9P8XWA5_9PEZI|nr:glycoside hydrolase superfamily [Microdochium trichocladiopsis]KAH7018501.1 glycoside hydrolase superfamily [Microdochium trichocladiopsis]
MALYTTNSNTLSPFKALSIATALLLSSASRVLVTARLHKAPTPPMGWNSYNAYSCTPTEAIIKLNAQGLKDLGFYDLGYDIVTVDCGWPADARDPQTGKLVWNETLFPSGPEALGEFVHGLGMKFGLYSGAGYLQCGSEAIPASLGYEAVDAQSFADWGGDTLKYDNCYSTSRTVMVDSSSAESQSPRRFQVMADELAKTDRDIQYFLCQWGIGQNVPEWSVPIANSWRMSNDIYNAWKSIPRIVNQAVAHSPSSQPGAFADLDMLIVGLNALNPDEERLHFGMWAALKSPLIIGGIMDKDDIPADSLAIMSDKQAIAINQDPLGVAADLVIRHASPLSWDIWAGPLSGGQKVVAVPNWGAEAQTVSIDLTLVGVASADWHEVWSDASGSSSGLLAATLPVHGMQLFVLSNIIETPVPTSVGHYSAAQAVLTGTAVSTKCGNDQCLPGSEKIGYIDISSTATWSSVTSPRTGKVLLSVDYINYEYHFSESWTWGTNVRDLTIRVNGGDAKSWAFPLSGNNWFDTGKLMVEVDGFVEGAGNTVEFGYPGNANQSYAPDLVGFDVLR